jgi:acyl-CoA thioesterase-1
MYEEVMSRTSRIIALAAIAAVSVYAVSLAHRARTLFANTRQIEIVAAKFPREYTVGSPDAKSLRYVAMGDSTAVGSGASALDQTYVYQFASALAQDHYVHVIDIGVVSARMADVARDQCPQLGALRPDVITVTVGANDAVHRTNPGPFRESLREVIQGVSATHARVYFATCPDLIDIPALPWVVAAYCDNLGLRNDKIVRAQTQGTGIILADLHHKARLLRSKPYLYASDEFHPSDAGYKMWAAVILAALAGNH